MKLRERCQRKKLSEQNKEPRIIVIVTLALLLAACGAPSERVDENPDGWEGSDIEKLFGEGDNEEKIQEWPEEHHSCEVQELSGYLYDHTSVSVSAYASAEITIKDYEGEQLETDWDEPSAFQFAGEADVT